MTVALCPICKQHLVGYKWEKTKTMKNWLKHPQKGWHDCPQKKFSRKTASKQKKLFSQWSGAPVAPENGWENDGHGYYCPMGHSLGEELPKEDYCPICNTPTACLWLR